MSEGAADLGEYSAGRKTRETDAEFWQHLDLRQMQDCQTMVAASVGMEQARSASELVQCVSVAP